MGCPSAGAGVGTQTHLPPPSQAAAYISLEGGRGVGSRRWGQRQQNDLGEVVWCFKWELGDIGLDTSLLHDLSHPIQLLFV